MESADGELCPSQDPQVNADHYGLEVEDDALVDVVVDVLVFQDSNPFNCLEMRATMSRVLAYFRSALRLALLIG